MYKKVLFATSNPGKLKEITRTAEEFGLNITSPADLGLKIDVDEDGKTFYENAAKKAEAYSNALKDPSVLIIGDDSGIEIAALNNEPGVRTRRWNGNHMTDQEIVDYCLKKMKGFKKTDRNATFKTVLALSQYGEETKFFEGLLEGEILESPGAKELLPGLPFGAIFYVPENKTLLQDLHGKTLTERKNFMTHREKALNEVYRYIKKNFTKI